MHFCCHSKLTQIKACIALMNLITCIPLAMAMVHILSLQTCTSTNSVNCLTRSLGDSELNSGEKGSGSTS